MKENLTEKEALDNLVNTPISTIVKDATCLEEGSKTLGCECGAVIEEKIPAKGHSYEYKVKQEGTCKDVEILEESVDAIKNEAKSMQELVEKLLFLSRHDKKTLKLKRFIKENRC